MIKNLTVQNFTLFKKASFDFGSRLNVIAGENGTGKTQILKLLYTITSSGYQLAHEQTKENIVKRAIELHSVAFKRNFRTGIEHLFYAGQKSNFMVYSFGYEIFDQIVNFVHTWGETPVEYTKIPSEYRSCFSVPPVFLPARELLSIYPNFVSLYDRYQMPYDGTFRDTISALGLPNLNTIPLVYDKVISVLEKSIGGTIQLDAKKNKFFLKQKGLRKQVEIDMTAEGWRRIGVVMQLLRNGAISEGSSVFWDEPEANLNPKLIRTIVSVILKLAQSGVQFFLTTQSLFLLRELDLQINEPQYQWKPNEIRFFNFLPKGEVEQGSSSTDLQKVLLLDESIEQSERYLKEDF